MDAVCLGSATIDVFVLLHSLQKFTYDKFSNQISFSLGAKVPLDEYKLALGGNACNVAVGLSRLGLQTELVAEIGDDDFSKRIEKALLLEKVNIENLAHSSERNDHFNILLSYDGERTILEEKTPQTANLSKIDSNPKLIYLTSFAGDWQTTFNSAINENTNSLFGLNPGPRQLSEGKDQIVDLLPKIDVLFLNLGEAQQMTGEVTGDVKALLGKLKDMGTKTIVITDGRNGAYAVSVDSKMYYIDCVDQEKPKERTGAGDAYSTGFLFGLLNNKRIEDCMKYGAINAKSVISKVGAQEGLLTLEALEQAFQKISLSAEEL